MAHTKAQGSAKNLKDSKPKYLGVKLADGQNARVGDIIVRQRGSRYLAGKNVGQGSDYTLFALREGKIRFKNRKRVRFDGRNIVKKTVSVL